MDNQLSFHAGIPVFTPQTSSPGGSFNSREIRRIAPSSHTRQQIIPDVEAASIWGALLALLSWFPFSIVTGNQLWLTVLTFSFRISTFWLVSCFSTVSFWLAGFLVPSLRIHSTGRNTHKSPQCGSSSCLDEFWTISGGQRQTVEVCCWVTFSTYLRKLQDWTSLIIKRRQRNNGNCLARDDATVHLVTDIPIGRYRQILLTTYTITHRRRVSALPNLGVLCVLVAESNVDYLCAFSGS